MTRVYAYNMMILVVVAALCVRSVSVMYMYLISGATLCPKLGGIWVISLNRS